MKTIKSGFAQLFAFILMVALTPPTQAVTFQHAGKGHCAHAFTTHSQPLFTRPIGGQRVPGNVEPTGICFGFDLGAASAAWPIGTNPGTEKRPLAMPSTLARQLLAIGEPIGETQGVPRTVPIFKVAGVPQRNTV